MNGATITDHSSQEEPTSETDNMSVTSYDRAIPETLRSEENVLEPGESTRAEAAQKQRETRGKNPTSSFGDGLRRGYSP